MAASRITGKVLLVSCLIWIGALAGLPQADAADFGQLVRDATSGSESERLQALKALGQSGDPRALQPLLAAVRDDNPTIRDCARAALQTLADTLRGLYRVVAKWIDTFLITLGAYTSPPPPVETTQFQRYI
jgi:hypothetical protein